MPDTTRATPLTPVAAISSMATRRWLAELLDGGPARVGHPVRLESAGGVEVARRLRAGELFDVVVLARDAIDALIDSGQLRTGSAVDLAHSPVAVAVRAGAPRPDIGDEPALRRAVLAARTIGTSTGPSGVALARLFEGWGIAAEVRDRIVTPPAGVPIGALVASGLVELGFQQLSELAPLEGVQVLGVLPAPVEIVTTFSAAIGSAARHPEAARALIALLTSPEAADTQRRHGMVPAGGARGTGP